MTELTTPKTPTQTFEDNLKERLAKDIGELMPDDVLAAMINTAMNQIFFEDKSVLDQYGRSQGKTSVLKMMLAEMMEPKVKDALKSWMADHPEEIEKAIQETLGGGIFEAVKQHINDTLHYDTRNFIQTAISSLVR